MTETQVLNKEILIPIQTDEAIVETLKGVKLLFTIGANNLVAGRVETVEKAAGLNDVIGKLGQLSRKLDTRRKEIDKPLKQIIESRKEYTDKCIEYIEGKLIEFRGALITWNEEEAARQLKILEEHRKQEAIKIAEEAEKASKEVNKMAETTGIESLKEQAEDIKLAAQEEIKGLADMDLKTENIVDGNIYTSKNKVKWTADVCDPNAFVKWIVANGRWDMFNFKTAFKQGSINSYAESIGKTIKENGLSIHSELTLSTRR